MNAADKEHRVIAELQGLTRAVVAFSAGVDSTYLLSLAHEVLGDRVEAITADSASLARSSLAEAIVFCGERGIRHRAVPTDEFSQPAYLANDGQRCYHCKSALLEALKLADGTSTVLIGAIADDLTDFRPGMRAAHERGARFPLADAGMTKHEIRERSRERGLPTWDRPAEPCLSSRIPYGEPVELEALHLVEQAEAALRHLGFATVRARTHAIGGRSGARRGWLCRLEIPDSEIPRLTELRTTVVPALQRMGYTSVCVDLAGFTSGGFNRLLEHPNNG